MNISLESVIDDLFCDIPHTEKTDKAKESITGAIKAEYEKELEGTTSVQAFGNVLSKYGTLNEAGKLAGYEQGEIDSWASAEKSVDSVYLKKEFKKIRWIIYVVAYSLIEAFFSIVDTLIYLQPWYLIYTAFFAGILTLCGVYLHRSKSRFAYENIGFQTGAFNDLSRYSDKYSKKLINSLFLFIAAFFSFVFMMLKSLIQAKLKLGEAIQAFTTGLTFFKLVIFLFLVSLFCRLALDYCTRRKFKALYNKHIRFIIIISSAYWVSVITLILALRNVIVYTMNYYYAFLVVYIFACVIYNLTLRKNVVIKNIVKNVKCIVAVSLAIILVGTYQVMKLDSWILQPYISSVSAVEHTRDKIDYNDETGVYTITTGKEDFRILQLTDIHLGGGMASTIKDYKALNAVYALIEASKPDLVIVTGDLVFPLGIMSFSLNNTAPIIQFSSFMRNIGIPWAFVYGNHDTELIAKGSVNEVDELFKSLSYRTSGNLLYPYIQPDITGRNNQLIEIRNTDGSLNQALFLMDSNDYYNGLINDYDYIRDDEVEWYKKQVERLCKEEGKTVSSMLFFHMPLQQYKTAYELYLDGSDEVKYFFGENGEKMIDSVCCSEHPSKLFDTAIALGSTKAMFCGHDHYNNLSVEYRGIRLTYGMSIDYLAMPGIDDDTEQRGGTLISLHNDSTYDIGQLKLTDINK